MDRRKREKFCFVFPAYNEEENIENVVAKWHEVAERIVRAGDECVLVVANDGSQDHTMPLLRSLCERYPLLRPLDKPNSGHGATLLFLYRKALEEGMDWIFQTDSDGQTCPEDFWQLYEGREAADFLIGNRVAREDGVSRKLVSYVLRGVVGCIFHVWVKDANTPFRLMRASCLRKVLEYVPQDFFLCNVAISALAVKLRMRVSWYPIVFRPRQKGVNTINFRKIVRIGWSAFGQLSQINGNLKR